MDLLLSAASHPVAALAATIALGFVLVLLFMGLLVAAVNSSRWVWRAALAAVVLLGLAPAVALAGYAHELEPDAAAVARLEAERSLDNPASFGKGAVKAWRAGNYYEAVALVVIALVAMVRLGGQAFHDWLRDDHPLDKLLWFLFDTKPGRILKMALTSAAATVAAAWAVGEPITPDLVNPVLAVTFASSTLYGWAKDFVEWPGSEKLLGPLRPGLVSFLGIKVVV